MGHKSKKQNKEKKPVYALIKAVLVAIIISIALVALLSFLLYKGILGINVIPVANTVLKVIGVIIAGVIATCSVKEKRIVFAICAGVLYVLISFIIFSILCDSFSITIGFLSDLAIGAIAGAGSAFVCNLVKQR